MEISTRDLLLVIADKLGIENPVKYRENMIDKNDYCKHRHSTSSPSGDTGIQCFKCGKMIKYEKV